MANLYVRQRFHLECRAAGVVSIDCPYTFTDTEGLVAETRHACRLGYTAKSLVRPDHVDPIHGILTPSSDALAQARRIVEALDKAETAHVELDGNVPIWPGDSRRPRSPQPVVAALAGWIAFGEVLSAGDVAGGLMVAAALVLIRLPNRRAKPIEA